MRPRLDSGAYAGTLVAILTLLLVTFGDADARGGGRGGGGSRGGGFSRQGPAAGGGFSQKSPGPSASRDAGWSSSTPDRQAPSVGKQPSRPPEGARPPAGSRPPDGTRPPDGNRPPPDQRPPPPPVYYPPPPPGYYHGDWDYYDNDWVAGVVVGTAVVGTAVAIADESEETTTTTTTTTTTGAYPTADLPCDPKILDSNGVTYYLCGAQFYVQAYGDAGLIYMPVDPPR